MNIYKANTVGNDILKIANMLKRKRMLPSRKDLMQQFIKENPLVTDDEIEERFESWLSDRK